MGEAGTNILALHFVPVQTEFFLNKGHGVITLQSCLCVVKRKHVVLLAHSLLCVTLSGSGFVIPQGFFCLWV